MHIKYESRFRLGVSTIVWGWRMATVWRDNTIPRWTVGSALNSGDIFIKYNFSGERRSLPKPIKFSINSIDVFVAVPIVQKRSQAPTI